MSSSIESLDRAEDNLVEKIHAGEEEIKKKEAALFSVLEDLQEARRRLQRDRKLLDVNNERLKKKLECVLRDTPVVGSEGIGVENAVLDESVLRSLELASPFQWDAGDAAGSSS